MDVELSEEWRALAGVGIGYALATGAILVGFFLLPFLVVRLL